MYICICRAQTESAHYTSTGGEHPQGPRRELPSSKVEMRCLGFRQDLS